MSSVHTTEQLLFFMLMQRAVIVLAARAGAAIARRIGESMAVGEILNGVVLSPRA